MCSSIITFLQKKASFSRVYPVFAYFPHQKRRRFIPFAFSVLQCYKTKSRLISRLYMVTHRRIELLLPPWKGGVLTAWPMGHVVAVTGFEPVTPRVWTACSSQLSYTAICRLRLVYYIRTNDFCQHFFAIIFRISFYFIFPRCFCYIHLLVNLQIVYLLFNITIYHDFRQ